jgi:hypothetical protein
MLKKKRVGLIQTRGLGDIVIALPIADYLHRQGSEVFWPIDSRFLTHFVSAFPHVNFIGVDINLVQEHSLEYFYSGPHKILEDLNCSEIHTLYSHLGPIDLGNERYKNSLTFDSYKYAIAKVPFEEKWNFNPIRNFERENHLLEMLDLKSTDTYVVIHSEGSNFKADFEMLLKNNDMRVVEIRSLTDCIFDWLTVIEKSKAGMFVDSVYANIVEQLNYRLPKSLFFRSQTQFTPVFKNNWKFY